MFSQTVEYALRAVLCLAHTPGEPRTAQYIAETMSIPQSYLAKVMQGLVRQGLVTSQRGLRGGFVLVNEPADQSLLEIVNAVDPIKRIESCPLGIESHNPNLCPLHRRLDAAIASVEEAFAETTLQEILDEPIECDTLIERVTGSTGNATKDGS